MLDFDLSPYYDDFFATNGAQQNGYMQILFKPGFAVQARELTQMQTILQNQIGEFANNVFINGSLVSGAEITYDNSITSIQLQPYQGNLPITLQDFNNKLIVNYNSGPQIIRAKVVAIDTSLSSNTSAGALAVKYLTGIEFADGVEIQTLVTGGETSSIGTLLSANSSSNVSSASWTYSNIFIVNNYTTGSGNITANTNSNLVIGQVTYITGSGTISGSSGNNIITGSGTKFSTELAPGKLLYTSLTGNLTANIIGAVASITSNTSLRLSDPLGSTTSNIGYYADGSTTLFRTEVHQGDVIVANGVTLGTVDWIASNTALYFTSNAVSNVGNVSYTHTTRDPYTIPGQGDLYLKFPQVNILA